MTESTKRLAEINEDGADPHCSHEHLVRIGDSYKCTSCYFSIDTLTTPAADSELAEIVRAQAVEIGRLNERGRQVNLFIDEQHAQIARLEEKHAELYAASRKQDNIMREKLIDTDTKLREQIARLEAERDEYKAHLEALTGGPLQQGESDD